MILERFLQSPKGHLTILAFFSITGRPFLMGNTLSCRKLWLHTFFYKKLFDKKVSLIFTLKTKKLLRLKWKSLIRKLWEICPKPIISHYVGAKIYLFPLELQAQIFYISRDFKGTVTWRLILTMGRKEPSET